MDRVMKEPRLLKTFLLQQEQKNNGNFPAGKQQKNTIYSSLHFSAHHRVQKQVPSQLGEKAKNGLTNMATYHQMPNKLLLHSFM